MHAHLLWTNLVRLVEHNADFICVVAQRGDHAFELIADVQLVRVEEEEDEVALVGKPLKPNGKRKRRTGHSTPRTLTGPNHSKISIHSSLAES